MDRSITRRDFLQGVAVSAATAAAAPLLPTGHPAFAAETAPAAADPAMPSQGAAVTSQDAAGYYPPRLTGLRGSHPGSFENAHRLAHGDAPPQPTLLPERYDLIVVGAGISGLAAAHFYRRAAGAQSRILLLDNHDDFGGHAKRNEFELGGRMHLMNGGTLEIDSPRPYGPVAAELIKALGIDVERLARTTQHPHFYERIGLDGGVFFDRETFGADKLVVGLGGRRPLAAALREAPLPPAARADVLRIETGAVDYLPGLAADEKKDRLSRISYLAFLRDLAHVDPAALKFYQARTQGEWGVGIDAVSALDAWGFGLPGFRGLNLPKGAIRRMGFTPAGYEETGGSYRLHFPDGNATIARLLVRDLIPDALPGAGAADAVTARARYAELDRPQGPVRLRLSSTAVRVRHVGDPDAAREVEVTYVRGGEAFTVRGAGVVLAGYNMMIPYLCPELPERQKQALHALVKTPLVYTTVALRDWRAFARLGVHRVYAPGSYHSYFRLNPHVNVGDYTSETSPRRPILVHMVRTPCKPGLPEHDQNRAGRTELLATPFDVFERNVRAQLARSLAGGGFDPARDIVGLTVNRWPHGYAPEYNPLFDPDVPEDERAHVVGRAPFGRIGIANSDSGGGAYTDVAIEQGHRAVMEVLARA